MEPETTTEERKTLLRKTKILDFVENFETDPKERKSLLNKKKCGSG